MHRRLDEKQKQELQAKHVVKQQKQQHKKQQQQLSKSKHLRPSFTKGGYCNSKSNTRLKSNIPLSSLVAVHVNSDLGRKGLLYCARKFGRMLKEQRTL